MPTASLSTHFIRIDPNPNPNYGRWSLFILPRPRNELSKPSDYSRIERTIGCNNLFWRVHIRKYEWIDVCRVLCVNAESGSSEYQLADETVASCISGARPNKPPLCGAVCI